MFLWFCVKSVEKKSEYFYLIEMHPFFEGHFFPNQNVRDAQQKRSLNSPAGHKIELLRTLSESMVVVFGQEKKGTGGKATTVMCSIIAEDREGAQCVYCSVDPWTPWRQADESR